MAFGLPKNNFLQVADILIHAHPRDDDKLLQNMPILTYLNFNPQSIQLFL